MAETATAPPLKTLGDLVGNEQARETYESLPVLERLDMLRKLADATPGFRKYSDQEQTAWLERHGLLPKGMAPTEEEYPEGSVTVKPEPEMNIGEAAKATGKGVVQGLDTLPGMVTRPAGVLLEQYGKIPERLGLAEQGAQNVFTRGGQALQSRGATNPIETIVMGGGQFEPSPPGYSALQHIISSATSGAVGAGLTAKIYPLMQAGVALPTAEQVMKATYLAGQGASVAEVTRALGGGEFAQIITEMVGGMAEPSDIPKIFRALRKVGSLGSYIFSRNPLEKTQELATQKTTEVMGGPTIKEQAEGRLGTRARQTAALEDFVEGERQPVIAAQAQRDAAAATLDAAKAHREALQSRSVYLKRDADEAARSQLGNLEQAKRATDAQLRQMANDTSDEATQAKRALEQQKLDIDDNYRATLKQSRANTQAIYDEIQATKAGLQGDIDSMKEQLAHVSAANEKDVNDAIAWARKSAVKVMPEMEDVGARREQLGRAYQTSAGEAERRFYDAVDHRLKRNADQYYDALFRKHGIMGDNEDIAKLEKIITKYNPQLTDSTPVEAVQAAYAPRAVPDMKLKLTQIQDAGGGLGLKDVHEFRSRLLADLRHIGPQDQRYPMLKMMFHEVQSWMDQLAQKYPDAMGEYSALSQWYKTEIHRLIGGPGQIARAKNTFTGEYLRTPEEIASLTFGPGPTASGTTGAQANRAKTFATYLDDINDVIHAANLDGDTAAALAGQTAKDHLFEMVRARFYNAAIDPATGAYNQMGAAKWLRDHGALIAESPELDKLFKTQRDRIAAINEVKARAQSVRELPETYLKGLEDALGRATREGQAQRYAAAREAAVAREEAMDTRQAARQQTRAEELAARDRLTDARRMTTEERLQASYDRKDEAERIRAEQRREKYTISDEINAAREAEKKAGTYDADMQARTDQVIKEWKETFGNTDAAERIRLRETTAYEIGSTPQAIVNEIEAMGNEHARNAAWVKWMQKARGNETVRKALLQEVWQNFLGHEVIADPKKAQEFFTKHASWLKRFYPEYYADATKMQQVFAKIEELSEKSPTSLSTRSFLYHGGAGLTFLAAQLMGANWKLGAGLGAGVELASHALHRRQVAALTHMFMNPEDLRAIVQATQSKSPALVQQAVWSMLTRAGILHHEMTQGNE